MKSSYYAEYLDESTDNAAEKLLRETKKHSDEQIAKMKSNEVKWGKMIAIFIEEFQKVHAPEHLMQSWTFTNRFYEVLEKNTLWRMKWNGL